MALLTAAQKTAIANGNKWRHKFYVVIKHEAGGDLEDAITIHDDISPTLQRVIEGGLGKYVISGYNVALADPGQLSSGLYTIECDNSDGYFYTATAANAWFYDGSPDYQNDPVECGLSHAVYVWDGSAWSEITPLYYSGRIIDCQFNDDKKTVTIQARAFAAEYLDYVWTEDDAIEEDTGMDVSL